MIRRSRGVSLPLHFRIPTMPPHAATMTVVEVDHAADPGRKLDLLWLREHLLAAAAHLPLPVGRIGIAIVDDSRMARLHLKHSGVEGATDVLTFLLSDPGQPIIVDLALCVDEAARRAAELGHSVERELLLYAVHGLLHCTGFDDHDDAAYARMHAEEDRILSAIGVGTTFDTKPSAESTSGRNGTSGDLA